MSDAALSHQTFATPLRIAKADLAALLLRVSMGALFLAHAGLKIFIFTPSGTAGYFASLGLPALLAYAVSSVFSLSIVFWVEVQIVEDNGIRLRE
jgi:uncharacterized membrane protein YphA (DoxX/SURF4 family)